MMNVQELGLEKIPESEVDVDDLVASAKEMYIDLSEERALKLVKYLDLMFKWNETYNLTAVKDFKMAWPLHVLDSLSLHATVQGMGKVIDVGTGAGLPGVPLAILNPDVHFGLLDSKQKKTAFLEMARAELGLDNVSVYNRRVESFTEGVPWDCVVSRALAELKDMVELTRHLVRENGSIVCMKGVYPFEELNKLTTRRFLVMKTHVPRLNHDRHIVTIEVNERG